MNNLTKKIWDLQYEYITWSSYVDILWIKNKIKENNKLILDAACGYGRYTFHICNNNYVVCLDISKNAIIRLKSYLTLRNYSYNNFLFVISSITNIPFNNNSFDCILCICALQHLNYSDRINSLNEFIRLLSVNGLLFIEVFGYKDIRIKKDNIKNKCFSFTLKNGIYYHYFHYDEIINILKKHDYLDLIYYQSVEKLKILNSNIIIRHYYRYIFKKMY